MLAILTIFKSAKVWGSVAIFIALSGAAFWAYNQVYSAGYDAAELKHRTQQLHAVEAAVAEARDEWNKSAAAAETEIRVETEIVERVRVVEREIPRVVVRTVTAECRTLSDDVVLLFNEAIRAGSDNEGGGSSVTADPGS